MTSAASTSSFCPPSIDQRRLEDYLDALRRPVDDALIERHWHGLGRPSIDARARTHIAEWLRLHTDAVHAPLSPLLAPLEHTPWELCVVESRHPSPIAARRLRDHRGRRFRLIEGRTAPAPELLVALRPFQLPDATWASTLPLILGPMTSSSSVLSALFRSFSTHRHLSWTSFMRQSGARICLEYALAYLEDAPEPPATSSATAPLLTSLHGAFSTLEKTLRHRPSSPLNPIALPDLSLAWMDGHPDWPRLWRFPDLSSWQSFQHRRTGPWCRLRRALPHELTTLEYETALQAGLSPLDDGWIRIDRRDPQGHLLDPCPHHLQALLKACRTYTALPRRRVA